jgi:hypothetical protein
VTVTSTPSPGSRLPIGVTTVTGTATDAASNTAHASFTITVLSAAQQLTNLAKAVAAVPILGNSLSSQVVAIQSATTTAEKCRALGDFVSHVTAQRGKGIPTVEANTFLAAAHDIGGTLGC